MPERPCGLTLHHNHPHRMCQRRAYLPPSSQEEPLPQGESPYTRPRRGKINSQRLKNAPREQRVKRSPHSSTALSRTNCTSKADVRLQLYTLAGPPLGTRTTSGRIKYLLYILTYLKCSLYKDNNAGHSVRNILSYYR